ncbi:S1 family peptidase [Streptomyces sp. NPDC088183]|uniref:S1 family peptidase n=1 Tax=Streptomyces sp. NPDC088183 TaxID=3160992 RepID=UPI003438A7EE
MPATRRSAIGIAASAISLTASGFITPQAIAAEHSKSLTDPLQTTALARKLGDNRTGGVYFKDGRPVVAVTDEAAAQTVRDAGGTPEMVARSAAELTSIHDKLDELGNIPNTAWGVEARTNQVSVEIFDDVSAANQARIEKIAAAHPGAIRIDRVRSKLTFKVATGLRGGLGVNSEGWLCTSGFDVQNSSGTKYMLTGGHCVPGTGNVWYAFNDTRIGIQTSYDFGTGPDGFCDGVDRACDWASVKIDGPEITPYGEVRYGANDYRQITTSRYAMENEGIDRLGAISQDLTGSITKTSTTVSIEGKTMYGMYESDVCALPGDSGGPAVDGTTALGLLSGGTGETTCNSSSTGNYHNYFTPVQTVLNQTGLKVY